MAERNNVHYLLDQFLMALSTAIANIKYYSEEHPAFLKSINNVYARLLPLFSYYDSLKLVFTPNNLIVNEEELKRLPQYYEITKFFHYKKIRSLVIKKSVKKEEIISLLTRISADIVNILKDGEIKVLLSSANIENIIVEELDYSHLLSSGYQEENSRLWSYFMKLSSEDEKIKKTVLDNIKNILLNVSKNDLNKDNHLRDSFNCFLRSLEKSGTDEKGRFFSSLLSMAEKKEVPFIDDSESIALSKNIVSSLDTDSIINNFLNTIEGIDDSTNIVGLLTNILDDKKKEDFVKSLRDKIDKRVLQVNAKMIEVINKLCSSEGGSLIRYIIRDLDKEPPAEVSFHNIDYVALEKNYLYILLNFLSQESNQSKITSLLQKIGLAEANIKNDIAVLKDLCETIDEKDGIPECVQYRKDLTKRLERLFLDNIENSSFSEEDVSTILDLIDNSSLDVHYYVGRLKDTRASSYILKAFFKLYPDELDEVLQLGRSNDIGFLHHLIKNLGMIDSKESFYILKNLFPRVNPFLQREILRCMRTISFNDSIFIENIVLKTPFVEEGILLMDKLSKDERENILKKFLLFPNPLGIRNRILLLRLGVVIKYRIKEAENILKMLMRRRLFLSRKILISLKEGIQRLNEL